LIPVVHDVDERGLAMKTNRIKSARALKVVGVAVGLIASSAGFAVDSLPMAPGDVGSHGKTSSAKLVGKDAIRAGIVIDGSDVVKLDQAQTAHSVYGSGHQGAIGIGYGITRDLELDLTFRGTKEIMSMGIRNELYETRPRYSEGFKKFKETGYAGTRAMLKLRLLETGSVNIAIAPFVEEGMGERGMYSVTRNQKGAAGWMGLVSLGSAGIGAIDLNLGMRYREPQKFDDHFVRNEMFSRLTLTGYLSDELGIFAGIGGRGIMVADADKRGPDMKPQYSAQRTADALGGIVATVGGTKISIYGGRSLKDQVAFGNAEHIYGMSLTTTFGSKVRDHEWGARAKKSNSSDDESAKAGKGKIKTAAEQQAEDERLYPEMNPNLNDLPVSSDSSDDFAKIRANMKRQHVTNKAGLTEQQEVEAELSKIRAAEDKVQAEKTRRNLLSERKRKALEKENVRRNTKLDNELQKRTREELDDEYGITTEDTSWNGLDQ
jgi:hypothetical protein